METHVLPMAAEAVTTPLAIYGAVGTSAGFVKLIYDFLKDFTASGSDLDALAFNIKHDLDILQKFMQFIRSFPEDQLTDSDIDVLVELNTHVQPMMARCEARIKEARNTASRSGIQEAVLHTVTANIKTVADDLRDWTQRLHLRASILSEQLKAGISSSLSSVDVGSLWSLRLQTLRTKLKDIRQQTLDQGSGSVDVLDDTLLEFHGVFPGRKRWGTYSGREVLVEYISFSTATPKSQAKDNVVELAMSLQLSEPTVFNIMKCVGYFKQAGTDAFALILEAPRNKEMRSLAESLESSSSGRPTLRQRFRLARELVTSLLFIHSFGWVHESIRSSNIVLALDKGQAGHGDMLGTAYLTGFERCRPSLAHSDQTRHDAAWKNNIYRSPHRIAEDNLQDLERHTMRHDAYSMGVVLLEIGIFQPLTQNETAFKGKKAAIVAQTLMDMARTMLPELMGETYTEIVLWCLSADDNEDVRSLSYLHGVVSKLENISAVI